MDYTPKLSDFGANWTFDISGGGYVIYDGSAPISYDSSPDMLTGKNDYLNNFKIVPMSGYTLEGVTMVFNPWKDQSYTYTPELEYDAVENCYYFKNCEYHAVEDDNFSGIYVDNHNIMLGDGYMTTIHVNFKVEGGFINDTFVNEIAVANWDTNGDGILSTEEAATVTSLGKVFSGNKNIRSFNELEYFTGLTDLPEQAFLNCSALESIKIPANVAAIGTNALSGCTSLATIEVDSHNIHYTVIDGSLYATDMNLLVQYPIGLEATSYTVPPVTQEIGRDAFYKSRLQEIVLPMTLRRIGFDAFGYCKALTSITVPDGVTTVGDYAFDHCTELATVSLPTTVTSIGSNAFNYCKKLEQVTVLSRQPAAIADNTFPTEAYANATLLVPSGTKALYENTDGWRLFDNIVEDAHVIVFKDAKVKALCVANWDTNGDGELDSSEAAAVKDLGTVFKGQMGIKSFEELRSFTGLDKITDNAFNGCQNLTKVIIPGNARNIGDHAFYANYKLTDVTMSEGVECIEGYAFASCTSLVGIGLPTSLRTILARAFYYDKKLASITLPENIIGISNYAFYSCPLLKTVTATRENPSFLSEKAFSETLFSEATLYVPSGFTEKYRNAQWWSKFANIKEMGAPVGPAISAGDITVTAGETAAMTLSASNNVAMVSFQVDVVLPEGVSLVDAAMAEASSFTVRTQAMEGNTWRVVAYSTDNSTVKANAGALLNLSLKTEDSMEPGEKTVTFQNFIMTDADFNSIKLAYTTAKMTVLPAIAYDGGKGDVNLDGMVNVQDVVVLVNYLLGATPDKFSTDNADTNNDNEVNISDVSALVSLCMDAGLSFSAPAHAAAMGVCPIEWTGDLSLTITDAGSYVAAQMDITVDDGVALNGIQTDGGHAAAWSRTGDNSYRLLLFSTSNDFFSACGPHVTFDAQGEGGIRIADALLVDKDGEGYTATVTGEGVVTGITPVAAGPVQPVDVYGIDGRMVRMRATTLNGLPAGVYIVNGRKVVVR